MVSTGRRSITVQRTSVGRVLKPDFWRIVKIPGGENSVESIVVG